MARDIVLLRGETSDLNTTEQFDSRYRWVIARRFEDGRDWYLRYCSTTGEPLWEDRLTENTERFHREQEARVEMKNYFLDGVFINAQPLRVDLAVNSFPKRDALVRHVI